MSFPVQKYSSETLYHGKVCAGFLRVMRRTLREPRRCHEWYQLIAGDGGGGKKSSHFKSDIPDLRNSATAAMFILLSECILVSIVKFPQTHRDCTIYQKRDVMDVTMPSVMDVVK